MLSEVDAGEVVEEARVRGRALLLDLVGFFEEREGFGEAALFEEKTGELVTCGSIDGVGKLDLTGLDKALRGLPLGEADGEERQSKDSEQDPYPEGLDQEGFQHGSGVLFFGWTDDGEDVAIEAQEPSSDTLDIVLGDGADDLGIAAVVVKTESVKLVESEAVGLCAVLLKRDRVGADEMAFGAFQFFGSDGFIADALKFAEDAFAGLFEFVGAGADVDGEVSGFEEFRGKRRDGVGEGEFVAQFEKESSTLPCEDGIHDIDGVAVGIKEGDAKKAEDKVSLHTLFVFFGSSDILGALDRKSVV